MKTYQTRALPFANARGLQLSLLALLLLAMATAFTLPQARADRDHAGPF